MTLVLHDWGCFFGCELAARFPQRISRIVGMDIGDATSSEFLRSLSLGQKVMLACYPLWLAMAWLLGRYVNGALGDAMTRLMARAMLCPVPATRIRWFMNFPYAMAWLDGGDTVYANGGSTMVWIDIAQQKSVPLPEALRQWLADA